MLGKELLQAGQMGDVMGPAYDYHGFKLQRHISDTATVITYKAADGSMKRMAVKDARFRNVLTFGTSGLNVPGLGNFAGAGASGTMYVAGGTISYQNPMPASVTNDVIFAQWNAGLKLDKTARQNCDIWMSYNNYKDSYGVIGVPAVAWCRNQELLGQPCDLANLYQGMVIYVCGDKLDELDASLPEYYNLRLGYERPTSDYPPVRCQIYDKTSTNIMHTSTECSSTGIRPVGCNSHTAERTKNTPGTAIPILELD